MTPNQLAYQFYKQHEYDPDVVQRLRRKFTWAIESGKIKRQPCAACGAKAEAHHLNLVRAVYSVLWLCREHHIAAHFTRGEKWGTNSGH